MLYILLGCWVSDDALQESFETISIDLDGDGYTSANPPEGYTPGDDCDDNNANVNPSADELWIQHMVVMLK